MQIPILKVFLFLALLHPISAKETAPPVELKPAQSLTRTAEGETEITYTVYAPENYDPKSSPRPILISFSPGGKGKDLVEKLKGGVEKAGWILVGCDKLRNRMDDRELELKMEQEVLDDIFKQVPHDPQRIYFGGFSGGAMRAYEQTSRRKEPIAGIVAYGGWLGGPDYQDAEYRKGLSVAMINGLNDKGANGWMPVDSKTLRKWDARVKHFTFPGGHKVAPPELTEMAILWLEDEWKRKSSDTPKDNRSPLQVTYVGKTGARTDQFTKFLSKHFVSVKAITPERCTLEEANRADLLILDSVVRSLPDGCTTAMLMIGSNAALTGERYGSKIDWLCQCLDEEAYHLDLDHPIFQGPLPVTPTLIEKTCPHAKIKIKAWKVQEPQDSSGLVSSRRYFENAKDSEIISGGVNMKGIRGVPLVREAHRLLWGFNAPPEDMTDEARKVFINALLWIHQFDGAQQLAYRGQHPRTTVAGILNSPYTDESNLIRWFPQDLLDKTKYDKEKLKKHFEGKLPYIHVPTGGGQLQIDKDVERLKTPNSDPESLKKWAAMLDGDNADLAKTLLYRYTGMRIRNPKQWKEWVKKTEGKLRFSDQNGYRFETTTKKDPLPSADRDSKQSELTDVAPVQFDVHLDALHEINGVPHQFEGRKVKLMIHTRVKKGWHFYAPGEGNGTNIPTSIDVTLPDGVAFENEWKNPPAADGELLDGAVFERTIRLGKHPVGLTHIVGKIRFQACTKDRCLMPQSLDFKRPLRVVPK